MRPGHEGPGMEAMPDLIARAGERASMRPGHEGLGMSIG